MADKKYCSRCGSLLENEVCPNGDKTDGIRATPFADYVKRKCKSDVDGKIFDLIKEFLKAHLFGSVLIVSVVFTVVASIASSHSYISATRLTPEEYKAKISAEIQGEGENQIPGHAQASEEVTETSVNNEQALYDGYYEYLKNNIVPEYGITETGPIEFTSVGSDYYWIPVGETLVNAGSTGIFGADIYDYDGDGNLDMIVGVLMQGTADDWIQGQAANWKHSEDTALNLTVQFYKTDNSGNISLVSQIPAVAQIDGISYGWLRWSVFDWEGTRYIYGRVSLDDMTTSGPGIGDIWHINAYGEFVHDKIAGNLSWGQGKYQGDLDAEIGTENKEFPAYLTYLELANLDISAPNFGVSTFTSEDHTRLNEILYGDRESALKERSMEIEQWISEGEKAKKDWEERQKMIEQSSAPMKEFAERLSEQSGFRFNISNESYYEGVYSLVMIEDQGRTSVALSSGTSPENLGSIEISTPGSEITEEFVAIKDVFLNMDDLGIDKDAASKFMGSTRYGWSLQNEYLGDGIEGTLMTIGTNFLRVTFN